MTRITDSPAASAAAPGFAWASMRWFVWHDAPVWPFVWHGLLPLLGLLLVAGIALWPFARSDIEASVARETREQLDAAGHAWAALAVSGQDVVVSGTPPSADAGEAALAAARAARCPSWAGALTCAVRVSGEFAPVALAKVAPARASAPAAPTAVACERSLAQTAGQSKIEFASGSAAIAASSFALLDALAATARTCPGVIQVEGHTDSQGLAQANQALSEARAAAVRAALVERGVDPARAVSEGFGAQRPLSDNASPAGRAQNRRIEFRVVAAQ